MTATGDQDGDHEAGRPETEPQVPPPPRWLDDQAAGPGAQLLPDPAPLPPFGAPAPGPPEDRLPAPAEETVPAGESAPAGESVPGDEDASGEGGVPGEDAPDEETDSDRTVSDIDISGTMRTQVFPKKTPAAAPPAPPAASAASAAPDEDAESRPEPSTQQLPGAQTIAQAAAARPGTPAQPPAKPSAEPTITDLPARGARPPAPAWAADAENPAPPARPTAPEWAAAPERPPAPEWAADPAPDSAARSEAPAPPPAPSWSAGPAQQTTTDWAAASAEPAPDAPGRPAGPGTPPAPEWAADPAQPPAPDWAAGAGGSAASAQPAPPDRAPASGWVVGPAAGARPPAAEPEPFPWAQEIPGTPRAGAPPADAAPRPPAPREPEPFPYAQEIPGAPKPDAAPEPFPWAQEIPDKPAPRPGAGTGPEPFPYAQEVPGASARPAAAPLASAPPVPADEPWLTEPKKKAKRKGRAKKPILITVAGLAAAAVVAAGGFVLLKGGDGRDGGTSGGGAGTAVLAGSLFAASGPGNTDGRDQRLTDVAAAGTTVVAVGGETGSAGSRGQFLVSSDGARTFTSAQVKGLNGGEPGADEVPRAIAASDHGWIAIGSRPGGAVLWTSRDGRVFERLPDQAALPFGAGTRVTKVVASGGGFLALGDSSKKGDFSDSVPAVWTSADGRSWEIRTGDQLGLPIRKGEVSLVTAIGLGNVLLMEGVHAPDPKKPARFRKLWRSQDGGRTWADSEVPAPKGTRGLMVGGGPAGFVAVREIKGEYGQAFTSKDGSSWTQAGKVQPSGYKRIGAVVGDAQGFAAIVVRGRDVLVSRSADGAKWQDAGGVPAQAGRTVQAAALAGGQSVLVGAQNGGDVNALLTVLDQRGTELPVDLAKVPGAVRRDHTVAAVAADGARAVAVGSAAGEAAAWTSADGRTWTRGQGIGAAFARPGPQRLLAAAAGKQGWLAVGADGTAPRRPLVVTSADGASWQAADGADAFKPGKGPLTTYGAAAGPAGYVIVGEDGLSGAAWFSADLKSWERGRSAAGAGGLDAQANSNRWLRSATGGAFGFAAAGGVRDAAAPQASSSRPAVWTSPDGKQWTLQQLPLPSGTSDGVLTQITSQGSTLVAVGNGRGPSGPVPLGYLSADGGRTWRAVSLPSPDGAKNVQVLALTATGKGFAATGTTGAQGAADVVSWTSSDGASWKVSLPGGKGLGGAGDQQITGLTAFRNTVLGVGGTSDGNTEQPVLWRY